jgi:hypothetical protein
MSVILYGCGTWSLTLREEYRLRVFENRVLRRVFGLQRGEMKGDGRKLLNEEFHNLYSLPNIIRMMKSRRMRWARHKWGKRNEYRILVGKPEGKRPLGIPKHRWADNIKIDLREDGMVWTGLMWLKIGTSGGRFLTQ